LEKTFIESPSIILAKNHFKKAQKLFGKNIISYSNPKALAKLILPANT